MSKKRIKERLEGSYRLIRIRRIKMGFMALQVIIAIVIGLIVGYLMGARANPFYFPLDFFIFLLLIFGLIFAGEAIYFKGLEIRYTRSKSRKYLIARNSIRRSGAIIAVAIVCAVLLFIPFTHDYISELHTPSHNGAVLPPSGSGGFHFESQDRMGLCRASTVTYTSGIPTSLYDEGGTEYWSDDFSTQLDQYDFSAYSSNIHTFTVALDNPASVNVTYNWEVSSIVSPILTFYIPILGFIFMIIECVSIAVMYPIRQTYATSSIYSKTYVSETSSGEYLASQRPTKADIRETELLERTLDLPPPPPPAPKPAAAKHATERIQLPPEKKEMARKKGVVDEGIITEPDIPCPSCGEMNSPHATMCFSCGAPITARPAEVMDLSTLVDKGRSFFEAGKYDDAISCYDEVLKHERTHATALMEKGAALHRQGKWGQAVQYVNTALQIDPRSVRALLLKANILEDRDRLGKAMEVYKDIMEIEPDNAVARAKLASVREEAELVDVEVVLEQFMCIPGVGLARATALYDAGYTNLQALKAAGPAELSKVKGISERLAKKVQRHLESLK